MKLILVSGARPNYMKIAPLVWAIRGWKERGADIAPVLVHTGQHYDRDLFQVFFRDLDLPRPDYDLAVGSGSHAVQTAEVMKRLEPVLLTERPDLVIVVGDVNSTLAAALTAAKMQIPLAHVEAGLRSFDRTMPEELNRILTDAVSDYLFTSEESGNANLRREGVADDRIFFAGNVMIDALAGRQAMLESSSILERLGATPRQYAVMTLHRPHNVDDPTRLARISAALFEIAARIPVVFPCHPRTRGRIETSDLGRRFTAGDGDGLDGVRLIPPLGYVDFLRLVRDARLVLTDSGGLQEETTVLGVPCLTLRENTERPVTVSEGTNVVVGTDPHRIVAETWAVLEGRNKPGRIPDRWDGHAADRVLTTLMDRVGDESRATETRPLDQSGPTGARPCAVSFGPGR